MHVPNFITIKSGLADPISSYSDSTVVPGQTVTVQTLLVPGTTTTVVTSPGLPEVKFSSSEARPNGLDGTGGSGGSGGFGGGAGASGASPSGVIAGGAGGSGMGGAIFVRAGGNLMITGNALFDNNQVNAGAGQGGVGSSISDGAYGSTAGTDMLMMKGSNVLLNPGQGNTIQFNGSIDDDSATTDNNTSSISSSIPTGQGAGLTVASGLVIFNGSDSYTGQTKITGGVLQADDGTGINKYSNINFAGGTLQSNGGMATFSRYLGTAPTGVQWTGDGGFAATGSDLIVSINNGGNLTWGQANFVSNSNALLFGSTTATNEVNFTNNLVLNAGNHTILATANDDNSDIATLSGNITGTGGLTINDAGHTGIVLLNGRNTYSGGTTIGGGTLALGSTGSLNSNYAVTVNAPAVFDISQAGSQAIGTLAGTSNVNLGANALTLNQNANTTLAGGQTIGTLAGTGNVDLGANTLTLNQNADTTFSGIIADGGMGGGVGGGLTKLLSGTLTLSGANTYTGTTQVSAGALDLTGSLASKTVNIASGASFNDVNAGLDTTAALTNAGTVTLGANDTIASFTNNAGTLNGTGKTLTATTYALNDGSVINANLGTGTMTNNGTVALNGTSDAATVNIASGTTTLGAAERLLDTSAVAVAENSNLVLGGAEKIGSLAGAGNVDLTVGGLTVDSGNFSGVLLSGNSTYGLTKVSAGTLALSGANTYTGATQINAGTIDLTGSLASNTVNVASGAMLNDTNAGLAATAALTNAGTVTLGADDTIASFTNNAGTLNGTGKTLTATTYALNDGSVINANLGTGTMTNNGKVALNGTSDAATVNIASGTTTLGAAERLLNTSAVTVAGSSNLVLGGAEKIGSLVGAGNVDLTAGGLTVDSGNFSGVLKSSNATYGLTKVSAGALALSGANTYTGATQINAGTIDLTGSLASNTVNVASGATLNDTNAGLAATAAVTNAGTVTLGANDTVASLTNSGTLNGAGKTLSAATYALNNGSVVNANLGAGTMTTRGAVTLNGTSAAGNINVLLGSILNLGDPLNTTSTLSHLTNPAAAVALNGAMNLYGGNEYIQSLQGAGVVNLRNNALFVNNGGAFTGNINGANTDLNVNGGSLSLNNGATTAQTLNIANGSNVTVGNTATVNTQTLSVDSGSTLNVAQDSTLNYTLLNGGTASQPGGTINAATFTNATGSTVGGFLTFTGDFVNNGTLSPGNSPGLINILGNLVENGSYLEQFQTNIPGTGYDQIRVGGTSTLTSNSVLTEQAYGGITPTFGNVYQIIANSTGGAIRSSGAFGNVLFQNDSAATPVNNAAVVFDVNTGRLMTTGLNAPTSIFADLGGSNANQRGAVSALMKGATRNVGIDQIDSSTPIGQATVTLLTTGDSLNRFVPTSYSGITDYALLSNKVVSDILFSRPLSASKSRGTKSDNFISDKNAYIGYTHNQYGFAGNSINRNDFYLGTEVGNEMLSVGALFLGSTGSISSTYGRSSVDGYGGTGYVRGTLTPDLTILGSAGYSNYNYDLSRSGLNGSVNAATSSGSLNTDLGLTYMAFNQNGYSIQPRLGLSYGNASVKGFHETGSTQGILGISGYNADRLSGQLGAVFAKDVELFSRPLNVALDVGVNEFFTDHKNNMNTTVLADTSIKFPISSAQNTKVFGFAGLGATYQLSSSTTVYAKYEANTMNSNDSISNNATVEFKTSF